MQPDVVERPCIFGTQCLKFNVLEQTKYSLYARERLKCMSAKIFSPQSSAQWKMHPIHLYFSLEEQTLDHKKSHADYNW